MNYKKTIDLILKSLYPFKDSAILYGGFMQTIHKIPDYNQELINIIPPNLSKDDIKAIKKMLVKYFAKKVTEEANKIWEEKGFKSAKDMEKYLGES